MIPVDHTDARHPTCFHCNRHLYNSNGGMELDDGGFICAVCVATLDAPLTIPVPEKVAQSIRDYIQYREDMAVAKFVLEQAEVINGKEKATA